MLSDNQIIENFQISKVLKKFPKSGQKQVFLVRHKIHGEIILKLVEGENERVKREISIVTENDFNNVPKVIAIDTYNIDNESGIYIFEQFIEGVTLRDILQNRTILLQEGMLLAENILSIIVQMEQKGIVHRDIKPENIIKSKNGQWYLIDFGIARALNLNSLTLTEVQVGPHTPGYGAPELFQYSKKDIDSRADIFSLGIVLFESLVGKHPFIRGDELNINEIWYNTVTVIPQSVIIDGDVDMQFMGLIQTFMQKHITRRPKTAIKAMEWYMGIKNNIMPEGVD